MSTQVADLYTELTLRVQQYVESAGEAEATAGKLEDRMLALEKPTEMGPIVGGAAVRDEVAATGGAVTSYASKTEEGTKHATAAVREHESAVGESVGKVKEHFTDLFGLGDMLKPLAAITIGGFALESEKHFEEVGHAADEMSMKLGLDAQSASALVAASDQLGVSEDALTAGFNALGRGMGNLKFLDTSQQMHELETQAHASSAAVRKHAQEQLALAESAAPLQQAFNELGIQWRLADGTLMPVTTILTEVQQKFQELPDGTDKAALAMKLFGRSGTELIPLLDQSSASMADLIHNAQDAGDILGDQQVEAAEKAYRAHKQLDQAIHGVGNSMAEILAPAMVWLSTDGLVDARHFSNWAEKELGPPIHEVLTWIGGDGKRYAGEFFGFLKEDALPIAEHVGHALYDFGRFVADDLVPPFISFVTDVGPPVIEVFRFMGDHEQILLALFAGIAARMVVIKGLSFGSEVLGWVHGIQTAEGALGKLTSALGSDGSAGALDGFLGKLRAVRGGASEAATALGEGEGLAGAASSAGSDLLAVTPAVEGMGLAGAAAATGGIALLGIAILGLATDAGGIRTDIKNAIWGVDQAAAVNDAVNALDGFHDRMVADLSVDPTSTSSVKDFMDSAQAVVDKSGSGGLLNFGKTLIGAPTTNEAQAQVEAIMDGVRRGLETPLHAWMDESVADWEVWGRSSTAAVGAVSDSYIKAAQDGTINWQGAYAEQDQLSQDWLSRFKGYNADAFDAVTAMHSRMVDAYTATTARQTEDELAKGNEMKAKFTDMAQQDAAAAVAAGTLKQGAVDAYVKDFVSKHMAAWSQVEPQYQAAIDLTKEQAQWLGISDRDVLAYGQDTVKTMLDSQHHTAVLNESIKATTTHLHDVNRQTADDARQFENLSGQAKVYRDHVADINQVFDDGRKQFNMWSGVVDGSMRTIDLAALHAQQDLNALTQQMSHLGTTSYSITVGGITHTAEGRYATQPLLTWFAEDGPEWAIPDRRVPSWARPLMADMLAGHAPAAPPVGPQFISAPSPSVVQTVGVPMPMMAPMSGGGLTIIVQQVDVHGVQDAAALFDELRQVGLDKARGRGVGNLFSSQQRGNFA